MAQLFNKVYINATGAFFPGDPVDNDQIDDYVAPLNAASSRIKRRVLSENGIQQRYYSVNPQGETRYSCTHMAAEAARACLHNAGLDLSAIDMLCTGTSGGDVAMPGFANMLQGELGAPPWLTASHQGVCAAGISALSHAALSIELESIRRALVVTSEIPSRLFKRARYIQRGYQADFDAHFLRWMLSDAAGAWMLDTHPRGNCSLRLVALHLKSFAGDYPVCMQIGAPSGAVGRSYLDYDNLADAEADGAFLLRQNIRLLPNLFDLGIHEYAQLVRQGVVDPSRINHFLCHYSSQKFAPVVAELLDKAGLGILAERWYSNLRWRGNTGAASIFVMLHDFLQDRRVEPGEQILCFIPESGRFTVGYVLLEVVGPRADAVVAAAEEVPAPHDPNSVADPRMRRLLMELAAIWHDYRSRVWRTPIMRKILTQRLTLPEFVRWMEQWIPQVREGSFWMRKAVLGLEEPFLALRALIETHAGEEQFDFRILFDDYRRAGGTAPHVESLKRNPGGEALHAYLNARAEGQSPIGLLGAIYIIEGTGQRIVPAILPALREQLKLPLESVRFLHYHGQNDINHLRRWLQCVETVLAAQSDDALAHDIVVTARATAELYLLQLNSVQVS